MLLDPERILADEVRGDAPHRLLLGAEELVAGDAVHARVGLDPEVAESDPRLDGAGRPGRMEGGRQADVDLSRANLRDAHHLPVGGVAHARSVRLLREPQRVRDGPGHAEKNQGLLASRFPAPASKISSSTITTPCSQVAASSNRIPHNGTGSRSSKVAPSGWEDSPSSIATGAQLVYEAPHPTRSSGPGATTCHRTDGPCPSRESREALHLSGSPRGDEPIGCSAARGQTPPCRRSR